MRSLVAASVVLVLAAGGSADDGKKYQSKDGKYAVAFPGEPKTDAKVADGLTTRTAVVEGKGVAYWVISTELPETTLKTLKPEEILENGEAGLLKSFGAKASESKATTRGKDKHPARESAAEVKLDGSALRVRLVMVLADRRMYQVLAIGGKDAVSGTAADKFFESFEVTK